LTTGGCDAWALGDVAAETSCRIGWSIPCRSVRGQVCGGAQWDWGPPTVWYMPSRPGTRGRRKKALFYDARQPGWPAATRHAPSGGGSHWDDTTTADMGRAARLWLAMAWATVLPLRRAGAAVAMEHSRRGGRGGPSESSAPGCRSYGPRHWAARLRRTSASSRHL